MRRFATLLAFFLTSLFAHAQDASLVPQYLQTLKPRCIGPANMRGRICAIAVYEKEPRIQYVASASGGLWKTINNGTTWKPVFYAGNVASSARTAAIPGRSPAPISHAF